MRGSADPAERRQCAGGGSDVSLHDVDERDDVDFELLWARGEEGEALGRVGALVS